MLSFVASSFQVVCYQISISDTLNWVFYLHVLIPIDFCCCWANSCLSFILGLWAFDDCGSEMGCCGLVTFKCEMMDDEYDMTRDVMWSGLIASSLPYRFMFKLVVSKGWWCIFYWQTFGTGSCPRRRWEQSCSRCKTQEADHKQTDRHTCQPNSKQTCIHTYSHIYSDICYAWCYEVFLSSATFVCHSLFHWRRYMATRSDLDQQKKGLDAFLGKGNSVMERMRLCGVNVDESDGNVGLDVQSTIFKRFQAARWGAISYVAYLVT